MKDVYTDDEAMQRMCGITGDLSHACVSVCVLLEPTLHQYQSSSGKAEHLVLHFGVSVY